MPRGPGRTGRHEDATEGDSVNRWEIRNQDDQGLCGIVTDRGVKAQHDRAHGVTWVAEADSAGRRLAHGLEARVGYDPLADPSLVLVCMTMDGAEVSREAILEVGEPDPSTVVMPPEDEPDA